MNILIVDDRPANLVALAVVLEPLGQRLVEATSGEEALRHLLHEDFACILLDVEMPGLDGFETARLIKQRERSRHTPLLFLAASRHEEAHIVRGYSLGAVDYLLKPYHPDVLRTKVQVFVDLHRHAELLRRREATLRVTAQVEARAHAEALAQRVREREEEFRRLSEGIPDVVARYGLDRRHLYVSPSVERASGMKPEAFLGRTQAELGMPPEKVAIWDAALDRVLAGEEVDLEYDFPSPSGTRFFHCRAVPERGADGRVTSALSVTRDVTLMRQSESRLSRLLAQLPTGVCLLLEGTDGQLRYVTASERYLTITGKRREELLGRTPREAYSEMEGQGFFEMIEGVHRTGEAVGGVGVPAAWDDNGDGQPEQHFVDFTYAPLKAADGHVEGVVNLVQVVDARVHAEAEREASHRHMAQERALLDAVVQQMPSGLIVAEAPGGRLVLGNPQIERILRHPFLPSSEVKEYRNYQGFHADGRPYEAHEWPLARALQSGQTVQSEVVEVLRGDGTRGVVSLSAAPVRDVEGRVTAAVVVAEDVTERRAVEDALRTSETRLRLATEASGVAVWEYDFAAGGMQRTSNHDVLYGLPPQDVWTYDTFLSTLHPEDRGADAPVQAALAPGGPDDYGFDFRVVWPDGSVHWLSVQGHVSVRDGQGRALLVRGTLIEVTRLKVVEADLREALRVRDEFLSVASHELKTPLTPLMLKLQTLRREAEKHPGTPLARVVLSHTEAGGRQIQKLTALVNDLLDVSRISAGRFSLSPAPVDLAALVREVTQRFEPEAARAGSTLSVEAPQALVGNWDALRLEQVVDNLVSNALKYGAGRPVHMRVETDGTCARLTVRDEGIGIAPEHIGRIFERFERAVSERHYGGLGLGLYITRTIVEALGGSVKVQSHPGEGATFTVELPLQGSLPSQDT